MSVEFKGRGSILRVWVLALSILTLVSCHQAAPPVLPIGGDFALTDHNGQRFHISSLRGSAVMIFFGYTSCPVACPTTLSKLSVVYRKLGNKARHVKTLFISVDPEHDTPPVLKADLNNFHIDVLGLTGTKAEIDRVLSLYEGSYKIVPSPDSAVKYGIAHDTTVYAIDGAGRTRIQFTSDATVDEIVRGLRRILADS
jgi:protein SCO1/2